MSLIQGEIPAPSRIAFGRVLVLSFTRGAEGGVACLIAAAIAVLVVGCSPAPTEITRAEGRLGDVRVVTVARDVTGAVFLFSDADGWTPALDDAARRLAGRGAIVVGVDLRAYVANLRSSGDGCHYVVAEIEDLSHRLEREHGVEAYRSPVLAGVGAGATLAYAALAQAPAATIAGAAGVDPAPALATRVPLCAGATATTEGAAGFRYATGIALPAPWRTATATDGQRHVTASLVAAVAPLLKSTPPRDAITAAVPELPIVVLPAATPEKLAAIIYSGDGGWRDLDKTIGETFAQRSVPVIGVDTLRYFWHAKTPERVATDLAAMMDAARAAWGDVSFMLVGYSFGAGILPFAMNRLPADQQARVVELSLLGLEPRAAFEIEVTGILGRAPSESAPLVAPELQRIDPALVQCFYGEQETATLCRDPVVARAELIHTAGSHHFDGNYVALADRILAGAQRRLAAQHLHTAASPSPVSGE